MKFGKKEYQETLVDPVAFHKYILGDPMPLTPPQELILKSIGEHMETIIIAGSKGGKSTLSAEVALWGVYRMLQVPDIHLKYGLTPGMIVYAMNIAPKEDTAVNIVLQYIIGLAERSWYLSEYIENYKRNELHFRGQSDVLIVARAQGSSSRAGRGYAIFSLILDEAAAFMDTRGNLSGTQVLNSYAPRLAPFGSDGRLLAISTPQGRTGVAWELFRTAKPIRVIQKTGEHGAHPFRAAFQYATWELNPLPQYGKDSEFMRKERRRDPWMFEREYGALFADVVSAFLNPEQVEACVDDNLQVPFTDKTQNNYVVTGDPGLEHDNYAIAMGHVNREGKVIVDLARKFEPPLNIIEIENFYTDLCKRYRVVDIVLDQHLSMATIQRLHDTGLPSRGISFGTKTDVKIYQNLLELINICGISFPRYEALLNELKFLQRVVLADRYRVEASPGSTDDLADAVAMLAYVLKVERGGGGLVLF